jgi:hypothetical protein
VIFGHHVPALADGQPVAEKLVLVPACEAQERGDVGEQVLQTLPLACVLELPREFIQDAVV